ncbi:DUF4407 domain-containing protein [Nocardia sp. PE-7]|uniref:DUF4407 domain-containing protein n=1 Tax=Nocardia sp. PE-7 TaxID=3058426 RepID=UPI002657BCA1|nr:DUF4407 domain-containing protein [Nocardia sp. PE-7]WKG09655.1 DUF4407 domain-containing protein [Nocardia sp. PE-7]
MTGLLTWLGGGLASPRRRDPETGADLALSHEQGRYLVTGAAVSSFALIAGLVALCALLAADVGVLGAVLFALVVAGAVGALGRALATTRPGADDDRFGVAARIGVGVLAGVFVAELAATVLLGGTVDRELDVRAQAGAESAPAVVAARTTFDLATADRAALDLSIAKSQADIDRALVIARCEYNPTPECPRTRITGVPGRGPETQTANDMLDDARKQLATAQGRVEGLDQRVRTESATLAAARTSAIAEADRGLGARWLAMNSYTASHAGAAALRLLVLLAGIVVALLPLLLRWWRGETSLDRRVDAADVADRAQREADAAIAVKRAEVRTETAALRAEHELTAAQLAIEADTVIDRERQRTRIIAAIGGFELGFSEPHRKDDSVSLEPNVTSQLPAGYAQHALPTGPAGALVPAHQAPVQQAPAPAPTSGGGLELPIIGTVPFTDTAARWIRPLVPSFVANAFDSATHPMRTARQAFEEVEEVTFTLRRSRKVTVDTQDSSAQQQVPAGYQLQGQPAQGYLPPGAYPQQQYQQPYQPYPQQIASNVVDAPSSRFHPDPRQYPSAPTYTALPAGQGNGLPEAQGHGELPGGGAGELPGGRRQLPPAR